MFGTDRMCRRVLSLPEPRLARLYQHAVRWAGVALCGAVGVLLCALSRACSWLLGLL